MKSIIVGLLFFLSTSLFAESKVDRPFLWKATKGGQTIYVMGTIHLGVSMNDLPPYVLEAVAESKSFYAEADVATTTPEFVLSRARYSGGQTLDQFLPASSWEKLVQDMSGLIPADGLKTFKPWYVLNGLAMTPLAQDASITGRLDEELIQFAKVSGVTVNYLETASLQFAVLEAIAPVSILDAVIQQNDSLIEFQADQFSMTLGCYQNSDDACIENLIKPISEGGQFYTWQAELLLNQRHRTWMPQMIKASQSGATFIAVGVAHLFGEQGLVSLLKAQGFEVSRVIE